MPRFRRRSWRAVAEEMLAGREIGSQCSREEAWRRACARVSELEQRLAELEKAAGAVCDRERASEALRCGDGDVLRLYFLLNPKQEREWEDRCS